MHFSLPSGLVSMSKQPNPYALMGDQNIESKINKARVLVVGAGGIGCEVLKNLVMSGFQRSCYSNQNDG